ncbi:hypothetical protein OA84_06965 [Kaistella solincola]|uniref:Uncharacterized protein n=1 Tax=Kaistella solincola TaxID=510955 RepID=A0ABR4ZRA2_9FLAO|nr:hypothetical protein OA84_06965 [Kaistella solincola]
MIKKLRLFLKLKNLSFYADIFKKDGFATRAEWSSFAERSGAKKRERSADKVARKILYYNFTLYWSTCRIL